MQNSSAVKSSNANKILRSATSASFFNYTARNDDWYLGSKGASTDLRIPGNLELLLDDEEIHGA